MGPGSGDEGDRPRRGKQVVVGVEHDAEGRSPRDQHTTHQNNASCPDKLQRAFTRFDWKTSLFIHVDTIVLHVHIVTVSHSTVTVSSPVNSAFEALLEFNQQLKGHYHVRTLLGHVIVSRRGCR